MAQPPDRKESLMAEPQTQSEDLSIAEATNAFDGLLAREEGDIEQTDEGEAAPKKTQEASEPPETPAKVEEPAEGEEEETTEQEAEPEEEPEEQPLYTVKVDGKEQQVALEELQRGYSGQKWISQRSQALSAEKKAFEAEAAAVKQERAQYAQVLGQLAKQLETNGEAEPDWEKLRAEDEFKFVVERQAWTLKQEKLNAVKAEQSRVQALQQQETEKERGRKIVEENDKVLGFIPSWKDEATRKKDVADLRAFALKGGWTNEEIDNATDARAVRALFAEYTLSKIVNAERPRPVTRGPRSASPGAGSSTPGRQVELTRDKQRLAQTGRVEDAADIFNKAGIWE
jgi:hypothetical protein